MMEPRITSQLKEIATYYHSTIVAVLAVILVSAAMVLAFYFKVGIIVDQLIGKDEIIHNLTEEIKSQNLTIKELRRRDN